MSKLAALQGKSQVKKIGEIEIEIKPLSLDDMKLFAVDERASAEEQTKASLSLIKKTLKESVPDATDEEISKIGFKYMQEIMEAIMEVNGIKSQQNAKLDIKNVIEARRAKIQNTQSAQ